MRLINNMFKTLKEIAPYRLKTFYKKNFRKFNGVKRVDEKMLKYINYNNGYYIEIGAHDGVHNSNTFYFEKYKDWNGILIEPSSYYNFLIKNRSKKNNFYNNGCSEFNSEVESILLGSGDYSVFKDLVDKEFFDWYFKKQVQAKKKLSKTKIKIRTLNSILIESKAPRLIDFFSLDVEGMEMKVLGGIDFDNFNFKYLLVECTDKNKFNKVSDFLIKKNYTHIDNLTPWDCLFKFNQ